jgi:hypothetical protein
MRDVKPTDLIEHTIDLFPRVVLVVDKPKGYSRREREFAAKIFPEIEEAGILIRGSSPWGTMTMYSR